MKRRYFIRIMGMGLCCMGANRVFAAEGMGNTLLNILLITADDMNFDSVGFMGCTLSGISPNLDKLARESLVFKHAHIMTAICGPSRGAFHTGRYPHQTGSMGHGVQPPSWWTPHKDIPPLSTYLHDAGYYTGLMLKGAGRAIDHKFDVNLGIYDMDRGRNPESYYTRCSEFFSEAKRQNKPFFLNANFCDPHKPWARSKGEAGWLEKLLENAEKRGKTIQYPDPKTDYDPSEIPMPPFLIDTPEIREEIAPYYDSVNRMDQCAGEVLRALSESGMEETTMVVFLSDHGMGEPFAKRSNYLYSTRTPVTVKWPGKVQPGRVDDHHVISTVDLVPTFIEAIGLPLLEGLDGRSLMPILLGKESNSWRERAYTAFNCMNGEEEYWPTRAMSGKRFVYVWNGWVDGKQAAGEVVHGGSQQTELLEKKWGENWEFGVKEEFYDIIHDPGCWNNLISNPEYQEEIEKFRKDLLAEMNRTSDPELGNFINRNSGKPRIIMQPDANKVMKKKKGKASKDMDE